VYVAHTGVAYQLLAELPRRLCRSRRASAALPRLETVPLHASDGAYAQRWSHETQLQGGEYWVEQQYADHQRVCCRPRSNHRPSPTPTTPHPQAIIGAGAAGLVTARELLREGHAVTVFEQAPCVGGTWVYTDEVDSDPTGRDPARKRVHSSMYRCVRCVRTA